MQVQRALRILVVEDHADTAAHIATLLRGEGHDVLVAPEGVAALQNARVHPPDVALLDIDLPGMDGYQVAERLQEGNGGKRPFLIAATGNGTEEDRRRSRQAGIDLHLLKPVDPDHLRALLHRFRTLLGLGREDG